MMLRSKSLPCFFLFISLLVIGSLTMSSASWAASNKLDSELQIMRITTPGGEDSDVPAGQQIIIEFDQPVISLGDNEVTPGSLPINIEPAVNCQWRWMDSRSLLCQMNAAEKLTPASQYTLKIAPGITTHNGVSMKAAVEHTFTTELPDIRSNWFQTWVTPGLPAMQIEFNLPVTKTSVEAHVFFQTEDTRIAIRAVPAPHSQEENPDTETDRSQTLWQIAPVIELPQDSKVGLKLEPGIIADPVNHGPLASTAERTEIEFYTFPEFKFLGVSCYSASEDKMVLISESNESQPICDPQRTVYLQFSSPVLRDVVEKQFVFSPDLANGRKDFDPWAGGSDYSRRDAPHQRGTTYDIWLPELLQAYQPYTFTSKKLIDEFGRELAAPIDLSFMTAHRQPNMELLHSHAVLEKQVDTQMPVYVTNLDNLVLDYRKLTGDGLQTSQSQTVSLPRVDDIAFAYPLPVRDLLNNRSGVVAGTISLNPNPRYYEPYEFFTQVTPYNLQVKLGHFSSLIWVTDLASGKPVADANVSIYKGNYDLKTPEDYFIQIKTDQQGLAKLPGLAEMTPDLTLINNWRWDDPRLMIRVEKDQEFALLPVGDEFTVWGRGVYPYLRAKYGHTRAWGTTAQGVYRPGDKLQYKLYVRDQNNQTLTTPPDLDWDLEIRDPTDKVVTELKSIKLNEFGAFDGEYDLPKNASVGWYRFILKHSVDKGTEDEQEKIRLEPLKVLVSDFTPAPFKVSTELNGKLFKPGDELQIATAARLHAGGPYSQAQTRVTANLTASHFSSKHAIARDFQFDTHLNQNYPSTTLLQKQEMLNDKGDLQTTLPLTSELDYKDIIYGSLRIESSVQDDRGKSVAKQTSAKFIARDQLVGLKNTRWVYEAGQDNEIQYLVVDEKGQPIAGTPVDLTIERSEVKASRVKSAGNAYVTNYITNWIAAGSCSGTSSHEASTCTFKPEQPGDYRITAKIKDSKGHDHSSQISAWVVGKGQVLWEQPTNNNLTIIPENDNLKIGLKVGDTARYLVKNPYPGSKALISIERYGILKSWIADFSNSTEIIEFPVEEDFMPGFYLSITVFSPRVDKPLGDNNVDLGKPAFSMGYLKVPVTDPVKQLVVEISSKEEIYKPGDEIELTFSGQPRMPNQKADQDSDQKKDIELAIIVLDEAVFDLIQQGEKYFDPYQGFYSLQGLDVANYNLISRLIGRQKFEKKGANQGGDGGSEINFRSIDKYIGYWNPSLILASGESQSISFTAPDNLTGWRVFAMAVTKGDRLGLGTADFKVNKAIELRPVMPNQVMAGDQFKAGFSVMNRTEKEREITVDISATGSVVNGSEISKTLKLEPFKRETVWLPIKTFAQRGNIKLIASARSGNESDGLSHNVPVLKREVLDTVAEYTSFTDAVSTTPIQFPKNIRSDTGELSISLSATVIGNVEGAFRYMRDYPYFCWEQRLSKGVMADHYQTLRDYLPADLDWPESNKGSGNITLELLKDASNFQAPNGGMAFWIPKDEYVSPYLSAYTALAFSWLKESGHKIPDQVETALHVYLDTLLKRDTMPSFYDQGITSTVRAVALAALAREGKVSKDRLERYRDHVPQMSLFGQAHYLSAASKVEDTEEIINETFDRIMKHSVQSAGKIQFNESKLNKDYQRILATPLRTQCALLSAFMENAKTPEDKLKLNNIPLKLVRTITQTRGKRDHWENTQENLFCMNALSDYSRVYEADVSKIIVEARLDDQSLGTATIKDKRDKEVRFTHKINQADPGRKATVTIEKQGEVRLYQTTRLSYQKLAKQTERVHSGIEIRREYSIQRDGEWQLLKTPMQIKRGELVRVDLFLDLPTARNFVVVDDPVPGGLEPVNRDLATSSTIDANAGTFKAAGGSWWFDHDDWQSYGYSRWSFYHQELRHDSVRFYSDYLNPGRYHLSYTAQAIASGEFSVLPVHSEEMYDSDIYGRGMPATLQVSD